MKVLVTGGTGFIGSNLANRLANEGHEVVITGTRTENKPIGSLHEIGIFGVSEKCFQGVDVIFHQAANNDTLDKDHTGMFKANVDDPLKLFDLAYEQGCRKFIYASSTAVYGNSPAPYFESTTELNPGNAYGLSKACLEGEMRNFAYHRKNVSVIGLRYCNVYGPGEKHKGRRMSLIGQCIRKAITNQPVTLFPPGDQRRDWIYVSDVVNANIAAMNIPAGNHIFNIGTGVSTSANELIDIIRNKLEIDVIVNYTGTPPESFQDHTCCDISKAKLELGWSPEFDCVAGISAYVDAIKKAGA